MKLFLLILSVTFTAIAATILVVAIYSDKTGGDLGHLLPMTSVFAILAVVLALLRQRVGQSQPQSETDQ